MVEKLCEDILNLTGFFLWSRMLNCPLSIKKKQNQNTT